MLWTASRLGDFELQATDGPIGAIRDCLFDAGNWTVRWFVIDTGNWLPGRNVLIAPAHIDARETDRLELRLDITRDQVRASPPFDDDEPVSREYEEEIVAHYGWQGYWTGIGHPAPAPGERGVRSADALVGCHIQARDGRIGHVDDVLIDPDGWVVRYLVVDTRDWWPGKLVLLVPQALKGTEAAERTLEVDLTREQVRNGPAFDPEQTIDRAIEEQFLGYYGYPVYW
ncbi:MAG: PRC-barrel domain-containing protein [Amaricoccus sp.]